MSDGIHFTVGKTLPAAAAFEHNGVLVSRAHFYAVACDPSRSVAVEACAGAGKTWMLVSRMVRAMLDGCAPQDILAITFTKKAAGEMRQRLQQWLGDYAVADDAALCQALKERGVPGEPTGEQLQTLRQLHATLLLGGRPVQIRTFHSWFAALLRSAPLSVLNALGLPTQYELLENDTRAVAQVWRRFQTRVAQDIETGGARADYLAAVASYGRHQTHKALEAALSKRVEFVLADARGIVDASIGHFTAQYPDFAGLESPLDRLQMPAVVHLLQGTARFLGASALVTCTKAARALDQAVEEGNVAAIFDALLTKTGTPRKFSDKLMGIDTVQQTQALLLRVQQAGHQHSAWQHQRRMARLARGLVEDYAALKRERGWIDMGDLERAALALMSDDVLSGWVQEKLDARVRHLLIDEFQDTNPLQWQALSAWLSGYSGAGNAPSVFIVGDPKQSIYRFRRAEPQVFQAAKAFVVQGLGGDVLSCDHTRRNAPTILNVVNAVMAQAQAADEFDGYRAHSTESCQAGQVVKLPRLLREPKTRATSGDGMFDAIWRDSLTTPRFEAEDTRKTLECRQAARWLAQMLRRPGTTLLPKDIMVLARKRERLGLMQTELAALHIAAQQPEKTDLCDMPEVQDIVALLDALVSNPHDLSLARALKSPLFSVSDADLVQLVLCQRAMHTDMANADTAGNTDDGIKPSWWHTLQYVPPSADAAISSRGLPLALANIGATLLAWKQLLDTMPPHDALSSIYQQGDVLARFAAAAPPTARDGVLANLRALLNAVLALDGGRYTTAYGLVRALRAGGIAAPMRADVGSVRLLTVHGAKGLEAPLVLLLDTDGESPKAETMGVLVSWPGEAAYPQRFAFLASESRPPACLIDALTWEQAARHREELNGLYVALTRTQTTLVISSLEPHIQNAGSWWQRLEPYAQDALWPQGSDTMIAVDPTGEPTDSFTLKVLKNQAVAPVEYAQAATKNIAILATQSISSMSQDSLESRLGQAMHRLLEWVSPAPSGAYTTPHAAPWLDAQLALVAVDFALDSGQVDSAASRAQAILGGEAAWVWDAAQLAWSGNEVSIAHRGRSLRIDRLVQHAATGDWWVLDYKSTAAPQNQPDLTAQLASYRVAVALAYPEQTVRAAFLTAQGALIEIFEP